MTTTSELVRDRIYTVIEALTPEADARVKFRRYRNEGGANFKAWASDNAAACRRRFQVRDTGEYGQPEVSNTTVDEEIVTFAILVAYPQTSRDGKGAAMDRDDTYDLDKHQIIKAISGAGRANFAWPYPEACPLNPFSPDRDEGNGVDFLEIQITMVFYRTVGDGSVVSTEDALVAQLYAVPLANQHVVIIGDSNAYGQGDTDNLDDQTLITADSTVLITQTIGAGDPFVAEYTIASSSLAPFRAGGAASMGVELTLGRALYAAGRTSTKISKWCSRGSSLSVEWALAGSYRALLLAFLDARMNAYGAIGIVYMDIGTNDATTQAKAMTWQKNATELVNALRTRYGNFLLLVRKTSEGLDAAYPYGETVREQQHAYVTDDPFAVLMDVDLVPLSTDNLHFTANNYGALGYRASAEMIAAMNVAPPAYAGSFPEYVGAGPGVSGAGALSPLSYPCPFADGYVEYLVVSTGLVSGAGKATLSEAAGFAEVGSQLSTTGGLDQWLTLFERRSSSRRMPVPTVADNNNFNAARIFAFRQPTTTSGTGINVSAFSKNDAYDTPISIGGVTSTVNNCLIALFTANYGGSNRTVSGWTNAALGSLTERKDGDYAIGGDHEIITCVTGTKAVAGATGATTATASGVMLGSYVAVAIKP